MFGGKVGGGKVADIVDVTNTKVGDIYTHKKTS
jgi:hypothetical protein